MTSGFVKAVEAIGERINSPYPCKCGFFHTSVCDISQEMRTASRSLVGGIPTLSQWPVGWV